MLGLFFKFNRFWSFRNFDLFLLILLAPGILLIDFGSRLQNQARNEATLNRELQNEPGNQPDELLFQTTPAGTPDRSQDAILDPPERDPMQRATGYLRVGFFWLLSMCLVFLARLLIDPLQVRKPLLTPNLTTGGLAFLVCSLMTFLYANIISAQLTTDDLAAVRSTIKMLQREAAEEDETRELLKRGPGMPLIQMFPVIPTFSNGETLLTQDTDLDRNVARYSAAAKTLAILSQSAIVLGLILVGMYHFGNIRIGFGMACIYLMLPYTAQYMGHLIHVVPGALLVSAIVCYRRPWIAGAFIGLAIGVAYYPLFLLPLWISFYWEKGARRFVGGVLVSLALCIGTLVFTSTDLNHFLNQLRATFGIWNPKMEGLEGIWGLGWDGSYRLPILVAFVALCISFVFWPTRKNLGTLVAYTCAILVAVQLWHGFEGGLIMAWYLPAALMTFFRPNLEGRDAKSDVARFPGEAPTDAETILLNP